MKTPSPPFSSAGPSVVALGQEAIERLVAIVAGSDDAIIGKDLHSVITSWNQGAEKIFGYTAAEAIGRSIEFLLPPERMEKEDFILNKILKGERVRHFEAERICKGARRITVSVTISPIFDSSGKVVGASTISRDVTLQKKEARALLGANEELLFQNEGGIKQAEEVLRVTKKNFRFMLDNTPSAIRVTSKSTGKVLFVNSNYCELFGEPPERMIGLDPRRFYADPKDLDYILERLDSGESIRNKLVKLDVKKEVKWALSSYVEVQFDGHPGYVAWFYDISERKHLEDQANHMAYYDVLTGLPNRRLLMDRLDRALVNVKRSGHHGALFFIDLDKLKSLNDVHGHNAGDQLLIEVGQRIKSSVREMDTVARIGGDEFVALIGQLEGDEAKSVTEAEMIAEKICLALAEPYQIAINDGKQSQSTIEHHCTASIGVVIFSGKAKDPEVLLSMADVAMYEAKVAGRNQVKLNSSVI